MTKETQFFSNWSVFMEKNNRKKHYGLLKLVAVHIARSVGLAKK